MGRRKKKDIFSLLEELHVDEDDETNEYSQWEKDETAFYPVVPRKILKKIPSGYYKILYDSDKHSWFLSKKTIKTDEIIDLSTNNSKKIIEDIKLFWTMKERYDKYQLLHKRGILMYGPQGSGKTSIINQLIDNLINDHKGVVFSIEDTTDLNSFSDFSSTFRMIEPDRPLIVIIEDIDGLLDDGHNTEKVLLNILSGINQIDNVVYIATTNYPEKIGPRLLNRPGRFDRRFKIGFPVAKTRRAFFESKMLPEDLEIFNLDEIVSKTKHLTIAHCKEIFTEYIIKNRPLDEVVGEMRKMNEEALHSNNDKEKKNVGFGSIDDFNDELED